MSVATGRERKSRRELVCIKSILRQRLANLRNAYLSVFYGAGSIAGIRSNVVKRNLNLFFSVIVAFFVDLLHIFVATRLVRIVFDGI